VVDGRSGEILRGQVRFHSGVLRRLQENYFVQLAAANAAARRYPADTKSLGLLIRLLVSHEVGHTLGLAHNGKAAAGYPAQKLRDRDWLREMGFSPTIMNYGFLNFVAQPEDDLPLSFLVSGVGPADRWNFIWLYGGSSAGLRSEQEKNPWLRASGTRPDATDLEESLDGIGRSDPVWTAGMGLKNLERTVRLMPADAGSELRARLVSHWTNLMLSVAVVPGGRRLITDTPPRYAEVPQEYQRAALQFLISQVFQTPSFLIETDAVDVATERLQAAQLLILSRTLAQDRFERMSRPEAPVSAAEMIRTLSDSLFAPEPDRHRSKLQRAYVEILSSRAWSVAQNEFQYLLPRVSSDLAARMTNLLNGTGRPTVVSDRPRTGLFPADWRR
jgi:hypothetical protein